MNKSASQQMLRHNVISERELVISRCADGDGIEAMANPFQSFEVTPVREERVQFAYAGRKKENMELSPNQVHTKRDGYDLPPIFLLTRKTISD